MAMKQLQVDCPETRAFVSGARVYDSPKGRYVCFLEFMLSEDGFETMTYTFSSADRISDYNEVEQVLRNGLCEVSGCIPKERPEKLSIARLKNNCFKFILYFKKKILFVVVLQNIIYLFIFNKIQLFRKRSADL